MSSTLDYDGLVRMLSAAAEEIRANQDLLTRLDSVGGDGDHGTTMVRAMGLVDKTLQQATSRDIQSLLQELGWAIMGVDGGAIGPLLGIFFTGMSEGAAAGPLDANAVASMLEAGLANLRKQTKAQPGDKTLMDALIPAVEAARNAASEDDVARLLAAAAQAATAGAEGTKAFMAKFGRARSIKEQSIGTPDPGATSISLIFKGFTKGVDANA